MVNATLRWALRISTWEPSPDEWQHLLQLVPEAEQKEVTQFVHAEDQKRALASRLLQRAAVCRVLELPWHAVDIQRTKGRRPFVANAVPRPHAPNFNYNVSHEGDYVVLASEPLLAVGCDVSAPRRLGHATLKPVDEWLCAFRSSLAPQEWDVVMSAGLNAEAMESEFRRYWCLKEAFVKARGDGIAFDLGRTRFTLQQPSDSGGQCGRQMRASVAVDAQPHPRWSFTVEPLRDGHWVSVARAPTDAVVDANGVFRATFQRPNLLAGELQAALNAPSPMFVEVWMDDLIPQQC